MKRYTQQYLLTLAIFCWASFSYASSIQIGDLLISEVLANPSTVSDSRGEYFELFNTSNAAIDINGFTISDDGNNLHTINSASSLFIQPGEYFVLGNNGDTSSNGGYIADYVYSDFSLTNSNDEIIISAIDNTEIVRLEYSGIPFGSTGASAELVNQILQPTQNDYAITTMIFGEGDQGTPGSAGSFILSANATSSSPSPVPVPAAIWLFGSALLMALGFKNQTQARAV